MDGEASAAAAAGRDKAIADIPVFGGLFFGIACARTRVRIASRTTAALAATSQAA
jgi:hypothetical protein